MKLIIPLFLLCCGPHLYPNQTEAMNIVWVQVYKQTIAPPTILWVESLDCHFEEYNLFDGWKKNDLCYAGEAYVDFWTVLIAHPTDYEYSNDAQALAHEYWHSALYKMTGNTDIHHTDPGFGIRYNHPAGGMLDQATQALKEYGL